MDIKEIIYNSILKKIDAIEDSYRRGYHHGFIAGQSQKDITEEEIRNWRYGDKQICPPGSPMEGVSRKFDSDLEKNIENLPLTKQEFDNMIE